jgi:hypothetical protein
MEDDVYLMNMEVLETWQEAGGRRQMHPAIDMG